MRWIALVVSLLLVFAVTDPVSAATQARKYYRLTGSEAVIGGVAGGLADYFNIDRTLVRAIWAVSALTGIGILFYLVLWLIAPTEPEVEKKAGSNVLPASSSLLQTYDA